MPASPAMLEANRRNSLRSTGPKTPEGKSRSRGNALKHGLTGDGVVLPDEDRAEVDRLTRAFRDELRPSGEVGEVLVRRMATLAVRMERSVEREAAVRAERIRTVLDEFEAPEGVDAAEADELRAEAGRRALFDPSKEACLARKYEAAAERGFFRALKEIRQARSEPAAPPEAEALAEARASLARSASFLPAELPARPTPTPAPSKPLPPPSRGTFASPPTHFDVPFSIGRPR